MSWRGNTSLLRRALLGLSLMLAAGVLMSIVDLVRPAMAASSAQPSLRFVATYPVPGDPSPATDVRWASDEAVYLSRFHDGVVEVTLQPGSPLRRQWVPDRETFGRFLSFTRLAVSSTYLATASHVHDLTWRVVAKPQPGQMVDFNRRDINVIEDIDLDGDRLLVLGILPADEAAQIVPEGIAWIGSLSAKLADLRPLLRDSSGPSAPRFNACALFGLGGVRFLPGGSFVIVPGFQPGANLYTAEGAPLRSWTQKETGLDTDCADISPEESGRLHTRPEELVTWLNKHRVLDDILPLPNGPGLLVRTFGADARVHWELRVLRPSGVVTYGVPLVGERPTDRLHGDVRDGRIVLLLSEHTIRKETQHSLSTLFVAELPQELGPSQRRPVPPSASY